eukprot:15461797-Alexandrium_andersonii.AAC.1
MSRQIRRGAGRSPPRAPSRVHPRTAALSEAGSISCTGRPRALGPATMRSKVSLVEASSMPTVTKLST